MSSIQFCSKFCPLAKGQCVAENVECSGKTRLALALQRHFMFHPGQLEALLPLMHGQDVFVQMATGAGKSLCMFLAPLALSDEALGIIISPLTALMDHQVWIVLNHTSASLVGVCTLGKRSY